MGWENAIIGFADIKAVFDKLKRENIWERVEKRGVKRRLLD